MREICDEVREGHLGRGRGRQAAAADRQDFRVRDIDQAFEHMGANKHLGKIVVTVP